MQQHKCFGSTPSIPNYETFEFSRHIDFIMHLDVAYI